MPRRMGRLKEAFYRAEALLGKADERVRTFVRARTEVGLRVFVSYRREAGPGQAHRLAADLEAELGEDRVFLDEEAIPEGASFDDVITERLGRCDVLIAVIGPGWIDAQELLAEGSGPEHRIRRLDNPNDYVRREIEAALVRRVPVIPVVTPGAALPDPDAVPKSLRPLLDHPALKVEIPRDELWVVGVDSLARWLLAIAEERRRADREKEEVAAERARLERDAEKARRRVAQARSDVEEAQQRRSVLEDQLPAARSELERCRREAEPRRIGAGIRVLISSPSATGVQAARLAHDLGQRLSPERVLRAQVPDDPAQTEAAIHEQIGRCDALLVVIGPGWPEALQAEGEASRPDPDHPSTVALEIEAAVARGIPILPVLVQRASLPKREALPERLRPLLAHHAMPLPDGYWEAAVERLAARFDQIESELEQRERAESGALQRLRELESELQETAQKESRSRSAVAAAQRALTELEGQIRRVQETEERLAAVPADQNPAFLAGPPAPRTVVLE